MKYLAAIAAVLFLPATPVAMAQGYGCSELRGGPYDNGCEVSSGSATRIIRIERQARGYPPVYSYEASTPYVENYTSTTVRRHPGAYAHDSSRFSHQNAHSGYEGEGAATSYGFEWWASDRYYGREYSTETAYTTSTQAYPGNRVTVYRRNGGDPYGATRPCRYQPAPVTTRTYTCCRASSCVQAPRVTTYYGEPSYTASSYEYTYEREPAHRDGYGYASDRDYAPVMARSSGYCQKDITRLRDDNEGRARYEVCFQDLTPVAGERAQILYSRIERAADEACDVNRGSAIRWASQRCEEDAIDRAVYDTGLASLASYHQSRTGRSTPRVNVGPLQHY